MSQYRVVGAVPELEKLNLPLDRTPSCSRRVKDGNDVVIVGCPEYRRCKLPERNAGTGPRNKGVRMVKKTIDGRTKVMHNVLTCYDIPLAQATLENTGGALQVIADEGEMLLQRGSRTIQEVVPGQGPGWKIEEYSENKEVPKFPRPGTGNNMADEMGAAEVLEQMRGEIAKQRLADAAGMRPEVASGSEQARKSK